MKITFLGTGTSQGVPVIGCTCRGCKSPDPQDKRLRSSLLVQSRELNVVIDTGPDFREQMLRCDIDRLDAVIYTHEHRDHIAGMDDIRSFNWLQQKPMDVYAEQRVLRVLSSVFSYVFAEKKYPGVPQVARHVIGEEAFRIGDLDVLPIRMMHYRLPVLGFRIGDFAYLTDANYIREAEKEKLFGVKTLVVNALRRETHISHFTLQEALELVDELSPRSAYLTHISHQMGPVNELKDELPAHVHPAYDGLVLEL